MFTSDASRPSVSQPLIASSRLPASRRLPWSPEPGERDAGAKFEGSRLLTPCDRERALECGIGSLEARRRAPHEKRTPQATELRVKPVLRDRLRMRDKLVNGGDTALEVPRIRFGDGLEGDLPPHTVRGRGSPANGDGREGAAGGYGRGSELRAGPRDRLG